MKSQLAIVASMVVIVLIAAITLAACGSTESSYFPTTGRTAVGIPRTAVIPAYFGIDLLEAAEGDRVRLEGIEPLGIEGEPTIEGIAAVMGDQRIWLGGTVESEIPGEIDLSTYRPVAGVEFRHADGPVALAVRVSGQGQLLGFSAVRLRFRVNGGPEQTQTIEFHGLVCTAASLAEAGTLCHAELESDLGPSG